MTRTRAALAAALVGSLSVLLAACAPEEIAAPAVTNTLVPKENRDPVPSPPVDPKPEVVWPLTGLDAAGADPVAYALPAMSVKIENTPEARPQTNLDRADIVVETYVEYGVSRLIAIYQSDFPDEVGNVRSMRPMDINIVGPLNGPLVFSGASSGVLRDAQATDQLLLAEDLRSDGFYRVRIKPPPHNVHIHPDEILAQSTAKTTPAPIFDYAYPADLATATLSGDPVSSVRLVFSTIARPRWDWDAAAHVWKRYERHSGSSGTFYPHVTVAGTQNYATNIVILRTNVTYVYGYLPKSQATGVVNFPGYVLSNGRVVPILWSKDGRKDPYVFTTLDGAPVFLEPGNTWIEFLPQKGSKHTQSIEFIP